MVFIVIDSFIYQTSGGTVAQTGNEADEFTRPLLYIPKSCRIVASLFRGIKCTAQ